MMLPSGRRTATAHRECVALVTLQEEQVDDEVPAEVTVHPGDGMHLGREDSVSGKDTEERLGGLGNAHAHSLAATAICWAS